ncbi:hypothetical protein D4R54_01845 [archaeon]|nr:MAG: hypothetical protein D4R54_01845 [archaeon]
MVARSVLWIVTILLWAMPVLGAAAILSGPPAARCSFNPSTDRCYPSGECYFDPVSNDCLPSDTPLVGLLKGIWGFLFFGALFGSVGLWVKYGK